MFSLITTWIFRRWWERPDPAQGDKGGDKPSGRARPLSRFAAHPRLHRSDTRRATVLDAGTACDRKGFAVWERRDGGRNVTFPARQYSVNGERRSLALLRPTNGERSAQEAMRTCILDAYARLEAHS